MTSHIENKEVFNVCFGEAHIFYGLIRINQRVKSNGHIAKMLMNILKICSLELKYKQTREIWCTIITNLVKSTLDKKSLKIESFLKFFKYVQCRILFRLDNIYGVFLK